MSKDDARPTIDHDPNEFNRAKRITSGVVSNVTVMALYFVRKKSTKLLAFTAILILFTPAVFVPLICWQALDIGKR